MPTLGRNLILWEICSKLKLILASDSEIYGGCVQYPDDAKVEFKKGIASMEINAFTGLLYEIKNDN